MEPLPPTSLEIATVVLYQPDPVLQARFPSGIEDFGAFLTQVQTILVRSFPSDEPAQEFDVVIAIKPEGRARFWFMTTAQQNASLEATLRDLLSAVPPPPVVGGPVAVAIIASVRGFPTSDKSRPFSPPMPAEWRDAASRASGPLRVPEDLLPAVWPD